MRVAILSASSGWHTDQLADALSTHGHSCTLVPYEGLVASIGRAGRPDSLVSETTTLLEADAVIARIIPHGSLEQIIYRVNALHWIEARGVTVLNSPRAIERSVDKFYATALLAEAGLPVPETVVCESVEQTIAAVRAMGDAIVKPLFGSMGRGMIRVGDPDTAFRVARALDAVRSVFYVQRAIEHGGRDIRAFVVAGRVIAAIERRAAPGEWRTNVARGGTAQPINLPDDWQELAVRASTAVGASYAGVDLLPSLDGRLYVLEVNAIPGWQGLQTATGIRVADSIVTHLEQLSAVRTAATAPA